jgi:hypothetical protein
MDVFTRSIMAFVQYHHQVSDWKFLYCSVHEQVSVHYSRMQMVIQYRQYLPSAQTLPSTAAGSKAFVAFVLPYPFGFSVWSP